MKNWLKDRFDRLRGTGVHAPTVPPMDGTLRPNTRLDAATVVHRIPEPDNLAGRADGLLLSSRDSLLAIDPRTGSTEVVGRYPAPVSAVATNGTATAIGLQDGTLLFAADGFETRAVRVDEKAGLRCITDLAFTGTGTLAVCLGSSQHSSDRWKHDLMERGASGRVVEVDLSNGGSRKLARNLAFPFGIAPTPAGVVVSEAWRHRLVLLASGCAEHVLANLPAYPSRLRAAAGGGYWLTLFAPRSQLIELVLRQRAYRERMMREVAPEYWVAPTLAAASSFQEPLQGGAIRTHGIIKPWAPSRSYGLVTRLDEAFQPVESYHSRADGTYHGIVAVAEVGSRVFVASKGGNVLLQLRSADDERGDAS